MIQKTLALIGMAVIMLLTACGGDTATLPDTSNTAQTGETEIAQTNESVSEADGILSTFSTTDINDNKVDQLVFADYKLTMVNVWATFCGPCINEMPDLGELAAEYKDKGVQIIGLVSDTLSTLGTIDTDQVKLAQDIVKETGADYIHILPSEDMYDMLSNMQYVPTTIFVNSDGVQVGEEYIGSQQKDEWVKIIDSILAEVEK